MIAILLFGFAGLLVGGVVSLRRNGASTVAVVVTAALAALAALGGVLWLLPE